MTFKKGDIVEVINEDSWNGIGYTVGTQMVVDGEEDSRTVYCLDELGDRALLYTSNLKLVKREEEEEKEMAFKIGEKYKCIKAPNGNFTEGKVYDLERNYAGQTWLRGNDGLKYTSAQCRVGNRLNTTGLKFEKVQEQKEMKLKVFDLNTLTTEELREYAELVEDKENAEFLLECFIEKVSK